MAGAGSGAPQAPAQVSPTKVTNRENWQKENKNPALDHLEKPGRDKSNQFIAVWWFSR